MSLVQALVGVGFTEDTDSLETARDNAAAQGMTSGYTVQTVLVRDDVIITVEKNGDHPAVGLLVSPTLRIAFNPEDTELALNLVATA